MQCNDNEQNERIKWDSNNIIIIIEWYHKFEIENWKWTWDRNECKLNETTCSGRQLCLLGVVEEKRRQTDSLIN